MGLIFMSSANGECGVWSVEKILLTGLQKLYIHIFLPCIFLLAKLKQKNAGQEDVNQ
jgi:hypothetical protein